MNSKEVRQKYLDFFKAKKHSVIPSASIIPENDPSTLFISSGMQSLMPYLLGEKHPEGARLVNSQKSFRAEDIEEVGDSRHTTLFEMLGNWSLGDYFKKEQLPWIFEFLIDELGLEPSRIYVSVYGGNDAISVPKDEESVEIWKGLFKERGIEEKEGERIFYYGDEKNWWSRSGMPENMPLGEPGGPDSEIFYDLGADLKKHENSKFASQPCHVNCDCGRFIEIGNNVFMEYIKTENGFEKLKQRNVDFGGGLERITMAAQGLDNIFETDLFINIIKQIEKLSGKRYKDDIKPFEVIADHLKASVFIMGDAKGIQPSNVGQGYVVRRLIRRAIRYGRLLGIQSELWTAEIAKIIADDYREIYPEMDKNIDFIVNQLKDEEEKFNKTLERGLKEFAKIHTDNIISGVDAFNLYQTYGFPIEMTEEIAKEKGINIDREGFEKEMEKHQKLSRTASAGMFRGGLADVSKETTRLHTAAHLMLAALRKILGEHVIQKGSNITAERLRFDFAHSEKMTPEQIQEVEKMVNEVIQKDLPVSCEEMSLEDAKNLGSVGAFESKYGEKVKVYKIGDYSSEICGGPHVSSTGELGHFKILKEQSSSAGVRRIKAVLEEE